MVLINTNRKGALPIPYIIALVLGIIVLAIVVYWLFFSSGEFGKTMLEQSCRAKKLAYCSAWELNSYVDSKKPNGVTGGFSPSACSISQDERKNYYAPECCGLDWAATIGMAECES